MLKIYKTYLQYQTDGSGWEQFGYSGWLCEEESDVEASKSIIENANFKQAFEHFENSPRPLWVNVALTMLAGLLAKQFCLTTT